LISAHLSRLAVDLWQKVFVLGFAFQSWHFWQMIVIRF